MLKETVNSEQHMLDMLPVKDNAGCKVRQHVRKTSDKTDRQATNLQTNTNSKQPDSQQRNAETGKQPNNKQKSDKTGRQTSDKTERQPANHLKFAIKSKSLDVFDRPNRKLHLTRFMSLSTMSSIPEDSCSFTRAQCILSEDDMAISYRSPVSIDNGYRAACKTGQYSDQSATFNSNLNFQTLLNPSLLKLGRQVLEELARSYSSMA